jgi:hypothetical protein
MYARRPKPVLVGILPYCKHIIYQAHTRRRKRTRRPERTRKPRRTRRRRRMPRENSPDALLLLDIQTSIHPRVSRHDVEHTSGFGLGLENDGEPIMELRLDIIDESCDTSGTPPPLPLPPAMFPPIIVPSIDCMDCLTRATPHSLLLSRNRVAQSMTFAMVLPSPLSKDFFRKLVASSTANSSSVF